MVARQSEMLGATRLPGSTKHHRIHDPQSLSIKGEMLEYCCRAQDSEDGVVIRKKSTPCMGRVNLPSTGVCDSFLMPWFESELLNFARENNH
jgi:hypothetical protein